MKTYKAPFNEPTLPLQELCWSITDCHHSTPLYTKSGRLVVRNFNIKNGRLLLDNISFTDDEHFNQRISRATPEEGDLIITREAPMGEVCIIPHGVECCLGQRMVLIKPNLDKIDNSFLLYALLSEYTQIQIAKSKGTGSIVSNLRIPVLKELLIPSIELSVQKKIAKALSDIDAKIELNNKINAELESMAKLIYDYWFVQFDFPDENGNPYKSSGGKMVYNEELKREIPEGWIQGNLSGIINFNPTMSIKKGNEASYIDMNALPVSGYMTSKVQRKSFSGGMKFKNGDVVIARITPCLENGKTALITLLEDDEIGFGSTEFIVLRGKDRDLRSFISCLSRSDKFRKFAISKMTGTSGRKRVKATALEEFKLAIPHVELLSKFEKSISGSFERMTINAKENQKLSDLRDWLLPMLMNGQVTVN